MRQNFPADFALSNTLREDNGALKCSPPNCQQDNDYFKLDQFMELHSIELVFYHKVIRVTSIHYQFDPIDKHLSIQTYVGIDEHGGFN